MDLDLYLEGRDFGRKIFNNKSVVNMYIVDMKVGKRNSNFLMRYFEDKEFRRFFSLAMILMIIKRRIFWFFFLVMFVIYENNIVIWEYSLFVEFLRSKKRINYVKFSLKYISIINNVFRIMNSAMGIRMKGFFLYVLLSVDRKKLSKIGGIYKVKEV